MIARVLILDTAALTWERTDFSFCKRRDEEKHGEREREETTDAHWPLTFIKTAICRMVKHVGYNKQPKLIITLLFHVLPSCLRLVAADSC